MAKVTDEDREAVSKLPYPRRLEDAATLAVESAFQELGRRGAFDEAGGLSESAMIFGKACAFTALKQLCEAAIEEAMPSVAEHITDLEARVESAFNAGLEAAAKVADHFQMLEEAAAYDKRQAGRDDNFNCARASAAHHIATAIRNLAKEPE